MAGEAAWRWGAPRYPGLWGVSCASCDPANELNRLHSLQSLLLGFLWERNLGMSRPSARMFTKKLLHLCYSCSSQCVKQDFGLAAVEVNGEALVDICRHGAIAGGCNSGVQVNVQGLLLSPPAHCGRKKPPPSVALVCAGSAEWCQGPSWWHSRGQGCAHWGATTAALAGDWVSSLGRV